MTSVIVPKNTILSLSFLFSRENHLHYWCLTEGALVDRDCYSPTKNIKLFILNLHDIPYGCSVNDLFSEKILSREDCDRYKIIDQLDSIFSKKNNNTIPDGYINSETGSIIIFKSDLLKKINNPRSKFF